MTSLFPPTSNHFPCLELKILWYFYPRVSCFHEGRPHIRSLMIFSLWMCNKVTCLFLSDY
jgi:hypothetical protein